MHTIRFASAALAAAALLSCGGDDLVLPDQGEPAAINILQGNGASGRVGEALAEPLIVEVLDGVDRPVAGATVVVELTGAVAEPDTLTTDQLGKGSAEITLGGEVGEESGAVRVIAPESPVEVEASFTVIAVASSANGLASLSGDGQTGPVGTALADPLVVEVTDAFGNPIEGVTITWTAQGGGSVSAPSTVTDGQGLASVTRTLGPTAGAQTTLAASAGLAGSPVVFNHTATAGSASGVQIVSGNEQIGAPGATLPEPLVVAVLDEGGNAVVGAAVTWVVTAGGGTLDPTTGTTDANGRSSTTWTLGSAAGSNTAQAIVSGVGQAEFTATATAGTPSQIRIVSGNNQTAQAGTALPAPLVVQVLDDVGTPVSGATVSWSVASGGGSVSPASAQTDAEGRAATSWTLGPPTGGQRVEASSSGAGSVRFDAAATVGAPAVLGIRRQPSPAVQLGVPFNRQPEIQVRDAAGNPVQVSGVSITAAIASGPGQLGGTTSVTTGANGRAAFGNLEINGAVGAHTLIFSASGLQSITSSSFTVNPVGTTTRITADGPDPSAPGEAVTVTFEVTSPGGTPTGPVVVSASGGSETCTADASAGQCVITLTVEGSRTLTASFQGTANFQSSSGNAPHSVVTPDTPPTGTDDSFSATGGVTLSVPAPGVLENDSDVDGDPLSAAVVPGSGPSRGTLTFRSNGSFDYTPSALFFGQDQFDYEVTANGASDRARVTIIVN
jgi:adhesin/invasin